jgi:hypothetical protein
MWKERLLSQEHHNDVNRFSAMVNLFFIIPGHPGGAGNSLKKAFNGAAATPVDYTGYRDSKGMQSQVWKSKAYKP